MTKVVGLVLLLSFFPRIAVPQERPLIVVAVLDTGLDLNDPRFSQFLCDRSLNRDFTGAGLNDTLGHGTHVAGSIIRFQKPGKFCLVIVKTFRDGERSITPYLQGLAYIRKLRPDVVNFSLAGDAFIEEEMLLFSENPGSVFFVAAGNDGKDLEKHPRFPASLSKLFTNVITVGALGQDGKRYYKSNYGLPAMIWELGENVYSTLPHGKFGLMTGTSMATSLATQEFLHAQ